MFDYSTTYGATIYSVKEQEDGTVLLDTSDGQMVINPDTTYICRGVSKLTLGEALCNLGLTTEVNHWITLSV
jgi:hypothetical protein